MVPRAESAAALPPSVPASHAHLQVHRRAASSSGPLQPPASAASSLHALSDAAAAGSFGPIDMSDARPRAAAADGLRSAHSDDDGASVDSRDSPGPETPYGGSIAGDAVRRRSSASSTMSGPPRRREFSIANIPPFRGRKGDLGHGTLASSAPIVEDKEEQPRRASGPSVFMIPAPAPIPRTGAGITRRTTGLGIEGLVSHDDSDEAEGGASRRHSAVEVGSGSRKRSLAGTDAERTQGRTGAQTDRTDIEMADDPLPSSSSPDRTRATTSAHPTKRPRTRLSPLDSLASTAADLLSVDAPEPSDTRAPSRGGMSIASLMSHPVTATPAFERSDFDRRHASPVEHPSRPLSSGAYDSARALEQQQRILDERRGAAEAAGAGAFSSSEHVPERRDDVDMKDPTAARSRLSRPTDAPAAGDGLGKRRGHQPPAIGVGSRPGTGTSSGAPPAHLPGPRHSVGAIPSVLVGGAMEAEYAARIVRDREAPAGRATPLARDHRRDSTVGPIPVPDQHPQPPLVSSSTYYIRPTHPLGGQQQHHHPRAASYSAVEMQGPRGSIAAGAPPSLPRHLVNAHRPGADPPPPPGAGPPGPSGYQLLQPSYSMGGGPAGYAPPPPPPFAGPPVEPDPDAASSRGAPPPPEFAPGSKQSFLSLFSTFYDSLADSRLLSSTLDGQVQRAGALLQTLQSAESALEYLVDQRIETLRHGWDAQWRHVDQRLRRIEEHFNLGGKGAPGAADAGFEDRLGRLEETIARRHSDSDTMTGRADRRSSGGSLGPPADRRGRFDSAEFREPSRRPRMQQD